MDGNPLPSGETMAAKGSIASLLIGVLLFRVTKRHQKKSLPCLTWVFGRKYKQEEFVGTNKPARN